MDIPSRVQRLGAAPEAFNDIIYRHHRLVKKSQEEGGVALFDFITDRLSRLLSTNQIEIS